MSELVDLLRSRSLILLDFDGPVCSLFAGFPSDQAAQALWHGMRGDLPPQLDAATDPFVILKVARGISSDLAEQVEYELTRLETLAAQTAVPTPDAQQFIRQAADQHTVVIVSNNSTTAINAYLRTHDLPHAVASVYARQSAETPLKPDPALLNQALSDRGYQSNSAVFIGDSVTDLQAADRAGIAAIALANKPGKRERFIPYQPATTISRMSELAAAYGNRS